MRTKQLLILIALIIILTVSMTTLYYSYFKVVKVERAEYSFWVQSHVGLVGDKDAVKFGGVTPGGVGKRYLSFRNTFEFPVKIKIQVNGDDSEWISALDNDFVLQPAESREISLIVSVPVFATYGNRTGVVIAHYIRTW